MNWIWISNTSQAFHVNVLCHRQVCYIYFLDREFVSRVPHLRDTYIFQRILEISVQCKSIFQSISHFQKICHHNCIQFSSPSSAVCLTQLNLLSFANSIDYRLFKIINNKIFRINLQSYNISEDIDHHEYCCVKLKSVNVFYSLRLITSLNILCISLPSR